MNPIDIIYEFYAPGSTAAKILIRHSEAVMKKSLCVAESLSDPALDMRFIEEAAMLHDIGIFYTNAPTLGCHGDLPYVSHGYMGRSLLEAAGYPRHALVCERHVGAGLSAADIQRFDLPLPLRDMVPVSVEEQIICYADKFFSKKADPCMEAMPTDTVIKKIKSYGPEQAIRFDGWLKWFGKS